VSAGDALSGAWLRRPQGCRPGWRRIVCFPHAGGGASFFRSWAAGLPPGVDVLAVQYPGREDRACEPAMGAMDELAGAVAEAVESLLGEPMVLFGHSMGAAVAYEVARRIGARAGSRLRGVVVSGQPGPRLMARGTLHLEPDDALWADVVRLNGTAGALAGHEELRRLLLPTLRRDYRLIETYAPDPGEALACPVVACVGDADPDVTREQAASWAEVTRGAFDLRVFPGDHFYLRRRREELLALVLRTLGVPAWEAAPWPSTP
jgi:pyochelin biosynthesis protein PchC